MPSRPVTVAIVLFWLFTAGWFVVRDVGPFSHADDPPPYTIELADEAQQSSPPIYWICTLNGQQIGKFRTGLAYEQRDDTFELWAKCPKMSFGLELPLAGHVPVLVEDYDDRVRVTRDGELRWMRTAATLSVQASGPKLPVRVEISAEVRGDWLERKLVLDIPGTGRYPPQIKPADPPRGSVLNPMHPVPRISGLRPGQTWRQPLTDPRTEIVRAALAQLPIKVPLPEPPGALAARVLPEPQSLEWNGTQSCYVVEYRGDEDYVARTWVRVSDGAVLRQEAGAHEDMIVFQRE